MPDVFIAVAVVASQVVSLLVPNLAVAEDGFIIPMVIRADMTIAGDQSRWNDLTYAVVPVACGHAMDVPDSMLYRSFLLPS